MKSTFIRIIEPGIGLAMKVNIIRLIGRENLSGKQIQQICSALGNHHGIAATPYKINGIQAIAVNVDISIPCTSKKVENNTQEKLTVSFDFDNPSVILEFKNSKHRQMLADLYFRNFVIKVDRLGIYKRNSESRRIFYERNFFKKEGDIGAFRRFELSEVIIDGVGIGINVTVGTAFFSLKSVEQYYQEGREERLYQLMDRMSLNTHNNNKGRERRGTLTFYAPHRIQTCYFERFLVGDTCGCSDPKTINGVYYESLMDYYKETKGYINIDDTIALVSFKNLSNVRVPAKKLFIRIFNDKLPRKLTNVDKIDPQEREYEINKFWKSVAKSSYDNNYNDFSKYLFYQPKRNRSGIMKLTGLVFGKGTNSTNHKILPAPNEIGYTAYKNHFSDRKKYLDRFGCFYVPPTIEQEIYFPFPKSANLSSELKERLASDICKKVSKLTKSNIEYVISDYNRHIEAAYSLKQDAENETGMTVFVFDGRNPVTYHQISSELSDWGLKRLTINELRRKYSDLEKGNKHKWDAYIDLISYDIIQEMNCIPWTLTKKLNYDIHLAIDVSEKFRYYDLSLMVHNEGMPYPIFINHIYRKTDSYNETINAEFLEDGIRKILDEAQYMIGDTLDSRSMLIYRDGKDCKEEFKTIQKIIPNLINDGILNNSLKWDYVEYRKSMMKGLRIYDILDGKAYNPLEGSYFDIHPNEWTIITTTGDGTLKQGTANPISIKNTFTQGNLSKIREDLFLSAQYNFSNPRVAQRLSLPLKRADEELQKKMAQEVKGLRIK